MGGHTGQTGRDSLSLVWGDIQDRQGGAVCHWYGGTYRTDREGQSVTGMGDIQDIQGGTVCHWYGGHTGQTGRDSLSLVWGTYRTDREGQSVTGIGEIQDRQGGTVCHWYGGHTGQAGE